jgi:hypothetical protein
MANTSLSKLRKRKKSENSRELSIRRGKRNASDKRIRLPDPIHPRFQVSLTAYRDITNEEANEAVRQWVTNWPDAPLASGIRIRIVVWENGKARTLDSFDVKDDGRGGNLIETIRSALHDRRLHLKALGRN